MARLHFIVIRDSNGAAAGCYRGGPGRVLAAAGRSDSIVRAYTIAPLDGRVIEFTRAFLENTIYYFIYDASIKKKKTKNTRGYVVVVVAAADASGQLKSRTTRVEEIHRAGPPRRCAGQKKTTTKTSVEKTVRRTAAALLLDYRKTTEENVGPQINYSIHDLSTGPPTFHDVCNRFFDPSSPDLFLYNKP